MLYSIVIVRSAVKFIATLPKADELAVRRAIDSLATTPRPEGCKRLKGLPSYRVRVGNYRIIYDVEDAVLRVTVIRIGHRKDVYR